MQRCNKVKFSSCLFFRLLLIPCMEEFLEVAKALNCPSCSNFLTGVVTHLFCFEKLKARLESVYTLNLSI